MSEMSNNIMMPYPHEILDIKRESVLSGINSKGWWSAYFCK